MIKCLICNEELFDNKSFAKHLRLNHNISSEEYYIKYISENKDDGICKNERCNNKTKFINIELGFRPFCSLKCSSTSSRFKNKYKETCIKKYGTSNPMKLKSISSKCKTNLDKNEISKKREKTCIEKYGVSNPSKIKETREKAKKTCLLNYGNESYSRTEEYKNRIKKISNDKYGEQHFLSSIEVIKKREESNLLKYNTKYVAQNENVKNKIRKTCKDKYGVDYASQSSNVIKKIKESKLNRTEEEIKLENEKRKITNLERSGFEFPSQNPVNKEKSRNSFLKTFKDRVIKNLQELNLSLVNKDTLEYTKDEILVKCLQCNKEYKTRWYNIEMGYGKCPKCFPRNLQSKWHSDINEFVKELGIETEINDRQVIKPLEIDILIESKKIGIELGGLYWHNENKKDKEYHLLKYERCFEAGYRLITIFEDEWLYKKEIVKNTLKSIFNVNENKEKIHARCCEIKEIDPKLKNNFLDKYHLLGKDYSIIKLGAFYNNELVSVMTFSHGSISRRKSDIKTWELSRFCVSSNYHIPGIASKILSYFKRNYTWKEIYSYTDKRWFDGNMYNKIGFTLDSYIPPDYWYVKSPYFNERIHRFRLRKKFDEPKDIPEWVLRSKEGYVRIWDCGKIRFIMKNEG